MRRKWVTVGLCAVLSVFSVASSRGAPFAAPIDLAEPTRSRLAPDPLELPDFTLTSHQGRRTLFSDLHGRPTLVFFGFTSCPNICPTEMQRMRQVQRLFEEDDIEPPLGVLISVDGERDTPEAMSRFLEPFGPDFVGLTGARAEVRPVADAFKAVFFQGGPTDDRGGYNVEHTSQIYLIDQQGMLRAIFYAAPASDIASVTRQLLD